MTACRICKLRRPMLFFFICRQCYAELMRAAP